MHGHPYRLMADFFNPATCERWHNPDDRSHKMFVVLAYLDCLQASVSVRISPEGSVSESKHRFNNV